MENAAKKASDWRSVHGDMSNEEWELIADIVAPPGRSREVGKPVTVDRRRVVDAIFTSLQLGVSGGHFLIAIQIGTLCIACI